MRAISPENDSSPAPRTLFIFAHPDDETIALGPRLGRFIDGLLIHVTDGAPRDGRDSKAHGFASIDAYRTARFKELEHALTAGGAADMARRCLNIPDQEASLRLVEITHALVKIIDRHRPEVIFTHAYEGGHPDHDACAFAVHHAVLEPPGNHPPIIECALYHSGPQGIQVSTFIPNTAAAVEFTTTLAPEEHRRKQAMLSCFASQSETLSKFGTPVESFRIASRYDFTQPPHIPPLLYDQFPWGMTSERFCELAREAENSLHAHEVSV